MVNKPTLANTEVNVLQAVNLTLGTSAILALADSIPKLVDFSASVSLTRSFYVVLLVGWTVKLIVENHRSFRTDKISSEPKYAIFQLAMTIAMFLALVISCKSVDSFQTSIFWLLLSMIAGMLWLAGRAFSYGKNFDWREFPWPWLVSSVWNGFGAWAIWWCGVGVESGFSLALMISMMLALGFDAWLSKSFAVV